MGLIRLCFITLVCRTKQFILSTLIVLLYFWFVSLFLFFFLSTCIFVVAFLQFSWNLPWHVCDEGKDRRVFYKKTLSLMEWCFPLTQRAPLFVHCVRTIFRLYNTKLFIKLYKTMWLNREKICIVRCFEMIKTLSPDIRIITLLKSKTLDMMFWKRDTGTVFPWGTYTTNLLLFRSNQCSY